MKLPFRPAAVATLLVPLLWSTARFGSEAHDLSRVGDTGDRPIALGFSGAAPQPAPPESEIFLASLERESDALKIGTPVNISNSVGYDNQPSFTPDGRAILFASARGRSTDGAMRAPATDIYRFDLVHRTVSQVTATPESEYSPTVTPDGRHISVIRVEAGGRQRLWRFTAEGTEPALVLADVEPVGYHAWIDDRRLALFVLGQPATLQVVDRVVGKADRVAADIGRSLQRSPGGGIAYVQVERTPGEREPRALTVMEFDPATRTTRRLVAVVPGAAEADLAWTPDSTLLMAHGGTVYAWRRSGTNWTSAADLRALGLRGVTRLAVSPSGDRIAIVAERMVR